MAVTLGSDWKALSNVYPEILCRRKSDSKTTAGLIGFFMVKPLALFSLTNFVLARISQAASHGFKLRIRDQKTILPRYD